ncbi:hypothetical protein [Agromyces laixinhei]|uniref:hypothetical protein n=1 Tax=Agromyces laixinhei TaxID=2585717 RepID=UPI0012ED7C38|nr:hypothetical protein [Agromyces laixinhei]
MAYYIGDIPSAAIVLDPPETMTLPDFDTSAASIISPAGTSTPVPSAPDAGLGVIIIDTPTDASLFPVEGIYRLRVVLHSPAGYVERIPDVPLVVQDPDSPWCTLDSIRDEWPDAETIDDGPLWRLLSLAREQVLAYAPTLAEGDPVPERYREAQRVQARNVWNASRVAPDGGIGSDDFVIRPFPLDWHVKQIIRPKRAFGGIA